MTMKKIFPHEKTLMGHCRSCGAEFDPIQNFCPKCSSGDVFNPPDSFKKLEHERSEEDIKILDANKMTIISCLTVIPFGYILYFFIFYAFLAALLISFISFSKIISALHKSEKPLETKLLLILWPFAPPLILLILFFVT